jgi:hypothetical protein
MSVSTITPELAVVGRTGTMAIKIRPRARLTQEAVMVERRMEKW